MELVETEKNSPESAATLRLVADNRQPQILPKLERQFVNFIFFRINPEWRKLDEASKAAASREDVIGCVHRCVIR